jgi:hypothetical protein
MHKPVVRRHEATPSSHASALDEAGRYEKIEICANAATARNSQAIDLCSKEIELILSRSFDEIRRQGHRAAGDLSEFGVCCRLVAALAKDKIRGTNSAAAALEGRLEKRLDPPMQECASELEAALARLDLALNTSTVTLAKDVAPGASDGMWHDSPIEFNVDTTDDIRRALENLGFKGTQFSIAVPLDVLGLLQTVAVQRLTQGALSLASGAFARPVATAAASATCVVADGPLPIGDMIAIGGAAYTAYDIRCTCRRFRSDLETSVDNAIPDMQRNVHSQVMERLNSLLEAHQLMQDDIRNHALTATGG